MNDTCSLDCPLQALNGLAKFNRDTLETQLSVILRALRELKCILCGEACVGPRKHECKHDCKHDSRKECDYDEQQQFCVKSCCKKGRLPLEPCRKSIRDCPLVCNQVNCEIMNTIVQEVGNSISIATQNATASTNALSESLRTMFDQSVAQILAQCKKPSTTAIRLR